MFYISLIVYALVCIWLIRFYGSEGHSGFVCPSKLLYGFSCPGCGVSRATLMFLKGDVLQALSLNVNVLLSIAFLFGYPILLCASLLRKFDYITLSYNFICLCLKTWYLAVPFFAVEAFVWLRNIILGI